LTGSSRLYQVLHTIYRLRQCRAGIETGRYAVTFFADKLLDKPYLAEVIPAIEFGGSFISPGSRRGLGVELSAKF
jgi:iron complex outermembrane receptor protein